ncbi:MAG: hypothetical protein ABFE01_22560, partial [Phycisphaerales bacterium]
EVLVKDSRDGKPIDGAAVGIVLGGPEGETDREGMARLQVLPGEHDLDLVYKEGYTTDDFNGHVSIREGETQRIECALTPESRIAGIVRDPRGKPLPGVELVIQAFAPEDVEVITDPNGRFQVAWDSTWLDADEPTGLLIAKSPDHDLAAAVTIDKQTRELDICLQPGVTLSGRITNPAGEPIKNAQVMTLRFSPDMGAPAWRAVGVESGLFEIKTLPARPEYQIAAYADGYGTVLASIDGNQIQDNRLDAGVIKLSPANLLVSGAVVDVQGKPVAGADITCMGKGLPGGFGVMTGFSTDAQGRFTIDGVCAEPFSLMASSRGTLFGHVDTEGGATDIQIVISKSSESGGFVPRKPSSLVGKSLPSLKDVGIELPADANDRMILVCLCDMNQRPSRRFVSELSGRAAAMAEKGVRVVVVQAADAEPEAVREWAKASEVPFAVGRFRDDAEKMRFEWGAASLPHLILTDKKRIVVAEGFELLSELDRRIEEAAGR